MIWFSEAYRWPNGSAWLGLVNPLTTAQVVTVNILGRGVSREVTVPPRDRAVVELGTWGLSDTFGVEVVCGSVCAASLVMWDAPMKTPNMSVPVVGCEMR